MAKIFLQYQKISTYFYHGWVAFDERNRLVFKTMHKNLCKTLILNATVHNLTLRQKEIHETKS